MLKCSAAFRERARKGSSVKFCSFGNVMCSEMCNVMCSKMCNVMRSEKKVAGSAFSPPSDIHGNRSIRVQQCFRKLAVTASTAIFEPFYLFFTLQFKITSCAHTMTGALQVQRYTDLQCGPTTPASTIGSHKFSSI